MFSKKTAKRIDLIASLILGPLILNEGSGYRLLDLPNGQNIGCSLDPTCHRLTPEQIELARGIFGDRIDYGKVMFFDRPQWFFLKRGAATSAFGNIYNTIGAIPKTDLKKDFDTVSDTYVYIHEMTHVWQYQSQSLSAYFTQMFGDHSYKYDIDEHEEFNDFGPEQQAEIIGAVFFQNYVIANPDKILEQLKKDNPELVQNTSIADILTGACNTLANVQTKAQQVFPVRSLPPACPAPAPIMAF